jgi:uncharacterized membrane protein YcaP (DUF421 family)
MESILRGAVTYLFVWLIFRIAGKRSLAQITTFDAVLLLIVSETTQASLLGNDHSITNSVLLILTLVGLDIALSCLKQRFPKFEEVVDGKPLVVVDSGEIRQDALQKERIDVHDILHAAREYHGIGRLDQIEHAVLEQSGGITVIPKRDNSTASDA